MARIGFIGLGNMGFHMALNLLGKGHVVAGYDRDEGQVAAFGQEGAKVCASAAEAAEDAEFVITMLPDGPVVEEVMLGAGGTAAAMAPGALHIDMSTILPTQSDAIREALAARGVTMIDAPVGRTASEARTGKLLIIVGSDSEQLERARPLFECMGDTIVHCGTAGSGIRMKLVNNYMTTVTNLVTAETLTLAASCGIETATALEVLRGTAAGRGHINTTYPDKVLKGDVTPGFMIALARKDLVLGLKTAEGAGVKLTTGAAALDVYDFAVDAGQGGEDWTSILNIVPDLP
ncbi:NAD-binding protein [Hoeflea sp. WL0058]|uniref:NAD-binding protein n=1 Tax=Flavimaribacter sediminis TaxID=2865987 RepID=A0AAE2ZNM3_9HYPH|nr:NAD(P)-binding domain-containing protein [Flavimaribacter sediminis]MBW8637885.1 NAD-binding protein [Flavimaribacter sediminis]